MRALHNKNVILLIKKNKRQISFFVLLLFVAVFAFLITGCRADDPGLGTDNAFEDFLSEISGNADDRRQVDAFDIGELDGEVLTIAAFNLGLLLPYAEMYMSENPGITIEFIHLFDFNVNGSIDFSVRVEQALEDLTTQIRHGAGPVLIDHFFANGLRYDPDNFNYFADWFELMYADPDFNEDDWFMNVFFALSENGKLDIFPLSFSFQAVFPNTTMPELSEAMSEFDYISLTDLFYLHNEFNTDKSYYLFPNFNASTIMRFSSSNFIDFETGLTDFGEEFINQITYARYITNPEPLYPMGTSLPAMERDFYTLNELYLFNVRNSNWSIPFFDFTTGPFATDIIPITDDEGRLLILPRQFLTLNTNATPAQHALAWDFVKFIMDSANVDRTVHISNISTNRNLLRYSIIPEVNLFQVELVTWELAGSAEDEIDRVVDMLIDIGEMPMQNMRTLPPHDSSFVFEQLSLFQYYLQSAELTALNIQRRVESVFEEMGIR